MMTETRRKCAVPTAQGWFEAARNAQDAGQLGQALLFMENAFNHTENALFATRKALEPFAKVADGIDAGWADGRRLASLQGSGERLGALTIGQARTAAKVLKADDGSSSAMEPK